MEKKVGYLFTDLARVPGRPSEAESVNELVFKAGVGSGVSERRHKETRRYEAKPNGKLLSFNVEQQGDGGDQRLEGTSTPKGLRVVRKRPGVQDQVLELPAAKETIEDADQVRVALRRGKDVSGYSLDGMDLETYELRSTLGKAETRTLAGVPVRLGKVTTVSQKEKVPVDAFVDEAGRVVELRFGNVLRAVAEPEATAKRLDKVEVFGLTRVVLPKVLPSNVREVPGQLTLVLAGLGEAFRKDSARQRYKVLDNDRVELTIRAAPPATKSRPRPLADPSGGAYLKSSIIVESDAKEIRALSEELVGAEKDSLTAARKISSWVYANLKKAYGASADRATDVLRQKKGDCTEHSLLAVALLRAAGIPAKRVDGVVYLVNDDGVPALYWHEWVEAFVGEWTQLDPTFGQPVADATHFALGEEGNAEITPLIGQLKVLEVR